MTKKFYELPSSVIQEILLMALTFKVSEKTLCEIYGTDFASLHVAINRQETLRSYMFDLFDETSHENEERENLAKEKALAYWSMRQKLVKAKNDATTEEEKDKYTRMLKNHREQIDDSVVRRLIEVRPSSMTVEEKDAIARSRVKYFLSKREAENRFHHERAFIGECCNDLALRDKVFAEHLNYLESILTKYKSDKHISPKHENDTIQNDSDIVWAKFKHLEQNNFKLAKDVSDDYIKEMIMAALTFRTSFVVMERVFNISEDELREMFKKYPEYEFALSKLDEETMADTEESLQESYLNLKSYWQDRDTLLKSILLAQKMNQGEFGEKAIECLKILRSKVDDSLAYGIAIKHNQKYSQEEKEYMAHFSLKYYISNAKAGKTLNTDHKMIKQLQNEYILTHPTYQEKYERLRSLYVRPGYTSEESKKL